MNISARRALEKVACENDMDPEQLEPPVSVTSTSQPTDTSPTPCEIEALHDGAGILHIHADTETEGILVEDLYAYLDETIHECSIEGVRTNSREGGTESACSRGDQQLPSTLSLDEIYVNS